MTTNNKTTPEKQNGGNVKNGLIENAATSTTTTSSSDKSPQKPSEEPMVVDDDDDDDDEVQEISDIAADSKDEETTSSKTTSGMPVTGLLNASDEPRDLEEDIPEGVVRVIPVPPKEDAPSNHLLGAATSNNKHRPSSSSGRTNFAEVANWLFQENYKLMCKVCFEHYNSVTELTAHGRRHVQDGLNVCTHRYCQNLQFASRDALQLHIKSGHRTDLAEAEPVIDIDHVPCKDGDGGKSGSTMTPVISPVSKDGTAPNQTPDDDEEEQKGRASSKKAKIEGDFSCAKCDFTSSDQVIEYHLANRYIGI